MANDRPAAPLSSPKPVTPPIAELRLTVSRPPATHGEPLVADFSVIHLRADAGAQLSLSVHDAQGLLLYETLLSRLGMAPPPPLFGATQHGRLTLPAPFAPGDYRMGLTLLCNSTDEESVRVEAPFRVPAPQPDRRFGGLLNLGASVGEVEPTDAMQRDCVLRRAHWAAAVPALLDLNRVQVAGLVSGFYPRETHPEGGFRWTGPQAVFQLRIAGAVLSAQVIAARPDINRHPVEVGLCAGETEISRLQLTSGHANLRFSLPEAMQGKVTVFTLKTSDPWRPSDLLAGNEDHRILGLALSRLESSV